MNIAATLNGRSLVLGFAFCLFTLNLAQAQIALSTYVCTDVVANSLPSDCSSCSKPIIQTVLGDDNTITPYLYTYCNESPSKISLNVGLGTDLQTFFRTPDCATNQFLALDLTKSTYAAQFYWDCKQEFIYKCPGYLVFDQAIGKCVPGGILVYGSVTPEPPKCGNLPKGLPVSTLACESLLYKTVPATCSTCKKPYIQYILGTDGIAVNLQYTVCADNGAISFDAVKDNYPHTFFKPDCSNKMIVALEPSKTTIASAVYYDCRFGIIACSGQVFDQATNKCVPFEGDITKIVQGLENCPKICGVVPGYSSSSYAPAPASYSSYAPAPVSYSSYAPRTYANPFTAYGK